MCCFSTNIRYWRIIFVIFLFFKTRFEAIRPARLENSNDFVENGTQKMDWKVTIITYNVAMRPCDSATVHNLLNTHVDEQSSIVAIGLQEVAHAETIGGALITWSANIQNWMREEGKLVLLAKNYQATNQVLIYVKKSIIAYIKKVDYRFAKNSLKGFSGHKGSIGVRLQLRSPFSIVFVDSHFVHDVSQYQKRISQYHANRNCTFPDDRSVRAAFWFGDLNFRVEEEVDVVMEKLKNESFTDLLDSREQLKRALVERDAFIGFLEQPIKFAPTYRMIVGTKEHDPKRTPSWCDRVLYKGDGVLPVSYTSNENALASDHLPVIAKFSVTMPVAPKSQWEVVFERLPTWYTSVPLMGRFQIDPAFYKEMGSYRDWVGVFPSTIDDCTSASNWMYFASCYQQTIVDEKYYVAEFSDIPVGTYRLGYFSVYSNCIVGLSKSFEMVEQP